MVLRSYVSLVFIKVESMFILLNPVSPMLSVKLDELLLVKLRFGLKVQPSSSLSWLSYFFC